MTHLFPSVLIAEISLHVVDVVLLGVPGVVLPQRPHEDHRDQADQEDDHHEGVEDGEPVNLRNRRMSADTHDYKKLN